MSNKEFFRDFWSVATELAGRWFLVADAVALLGLVPSIRSWIGRVTMIAVLSTNEFWMMILFLITVLWILYSTKRMIEKDRVEFRSGFLQRNPDFDQYEKVFKLYRLLAEAKFYFLHGTPLPGSKQQDWNEKVELLLRDIRPNYLDYYKLNLGQDSPFGQRVCTLEQTLEYIVWGDASNKP